MEYENFYEKKFSENRKNVYFPITLTYDSIKKAGNGLGVEAISPKIYYSSIDHLGH